MSIEGRNLMKIEEVGELKNRLSQYLQQVRGGEDIAVTEQGEVIAELRPPGRGQLESRYPGLAALARKGLVSLPIAPNDPSIYKLRGRLLLRDAEVRRLLDEERSDR
jgi:antitoxin (DNA-binding transcriptional repressor) of toxin-antitoxin stability system